MKLKDFSPTYKNIELMINDIGEKPTLKQLVAIAKKGKIYGYADAVRIYGNKDIMSYRDFHDSRTTSVILKGWEDDTK